MEISSELKDLIKKLLADPKSRLECDAVRSHPFFSITNWTNLSAGVHCTHVHMYMYTCMCTCTCVHVYMCVCVHATCTFVIAFHKFLYMYMCMTCVHAYNVHNNYAAIIICPIATL